MSTSALLAPLVAVSIVTAPLAENNPPQTDFPLNDRAARPLPSRRKVIEGLIAEMEVQGEAFHAAHRPRSSIDLGLEVLATLTAEDYAAAGVPPPSEGWGLEAIAAVCECSHQRIAQIQERAIRKLQAAARAKKIPTHEIIHGIRTGGFRHDTDAVQVGR